MVITNVRIYPSNETGKLKAHASVTFDDEWVIHGVRIVEGVKGVFVAMPSRKTTEGEYKDLFHPTTPEGRDLISRAVLEVYNAATK